MGEPYRVVDAYNQGWHPSGTKDAIVWAADYGFMRALEDRSYAELEASRGPLRPVRPITSEDETELRHLFAVAGRKAVTTLAAALESVFRQLRDEPGGSWEHAERTMQAGREGSWESACLMDLVLFGGELNAARRVDAAARDAMAAMLYRWVTDPARYTEVAETLASVVSGYSDEIGSGGWRAVADRWLQPGGLARESFSACYRLLYSLSEHFDSGLI